MKLTIIVVLFSSMFMEVCALDSSSQTTWLTLKTSDVRIEDFLKNTVNQYEITRGQIILSATDFSGAEQQRLKKIEGKVTDSSGIPLPGVTIVVKGSERGTITDAEGHYSFENIQDNAVLVFSFVGMKTQEIPVTGKVILDVMMEEESIGLEEVVAIGYGTMRKSDVTGSVASVKSEDIIKMGTISLDQALAGKVPGVVVTQGSGMPGSGAAIRIRGISSMRGSEPLYIIDGVPVENTPLSGMVNEQEASNQISPLSSISPSDIESMEVLKDASATAIYGSRGANGVVLITTKSGKTGLGSVEIDADYGIASLPHQIDLQDANEYWLTRYEALFNSV